MQLSSKKTEDEPWEETKKITILIFVKKLKNGLDGL